MPWNGTIDNEMLALYYSINSVFINVYMQSTGIFQVYFSTSQK